MAALWFAAPLTSRAQEGSVELKRRAVLNGHPALVQCLAFSGDGKTLMTGSSPKISLEGQNYDTFIAWNVADGKRKFLIPHQQTFNSFAPLNDGTAVVIPNGNTVTIFDMKAGKPMPSPTGTVQESVITAAVPKDGKIIAAGTFDSGNILLIDRRTRKVQKTLKGHKKGITALTFSSDGKRLASGSYDGSVMLWDVKTAKAMHTIAVGKEEGEPITCLKFAPDGSTLATLISDGAVSFWDVITGVKQEAKAEFPTISLRGIDYSSDGKLIVTCSANLFPSPSKGAVMLWDAKTGEKLFEVEDTDGISTDVAFSPDGKTVASSGGNTAKLWDVVSKK